ncbi:helix-turn-helix transcriptional regulator [Xanthobacter sp. DSM 24535]|uniref:helix-turn-helix domain-containing protein n=1 Tax=Roseixanthobacter psychrophilus TaxID=3119917 RepID=UPI00372B15CE
MITSDQIRAARALVRLDQAELAAAAGVSVETIKRIERSDGSANAQHATLQSIQRALELKGALFLSASEEAPGGPGVRMALDPDKLLKIELINSARSSAEASLEAALMKQKRGSSLDKEQLIQDISSSFTFLLRKDLERLFTR